MKKGIYRIAACVGAAVIMVSSVTIQAAAVTTNGTPAPVATESIAGWPTAPAVTSETAVMIDAETGAVLYDKGMNECRYPASITKIMTLLVAIENSSPKDIVTFTETGIRDVTWDSSNINAQLGETMTMKDCWMAAYIQSANEVCAQIAEYVGGSEADFVTMMNQRAEELGCTHTNFTNASGLPDENHYSSALDMAKIMRAALQNKRFCQVAKCRRYTIPATNMSAERPLCTHMPLMAKGTGLYYEGCLGGKTGQTADAGHTFVAAAERDGRTYIVVTMKASELGINCADTIALFDYAFDSFESINIDGRQMTVPKGVTVNDLTTDVVERNGKTLNRYFYSGEFVGYVIAPEPTATPTPQPTADAENTELTEGAVQNESTENLEETQKKSISQQIQELKEEGISGISGTLRVLVITAGVMAVLLIGLLIALYIKKN